MQSHSFRALRPTTLNIYRGNGEVKSLVVHGGSQCWRLLVSVLVSVSAVARAARLLRYPA